MNNIPVIDLVLLILLALMVIRGYVKGFVEEIFSWASKVLAIGAAVFFYIPGAAYIRTRIMQDVRYVPEVLAFIAIFLIVFLFLKILERILKDVVSGTNLKGVNKFLGLILGIVEGFAFIGLILFVLYIQPLFDASAIIDDSIFAEILLPQITTRLPSEGVRDVIETVLPVMPGFGITV